MHWFWGSMPILTGSTKNLEFSPFVEYHLPATHSRSADSAVTEGFLKSHECYPYRSTCHVFWEGASISDHWDQLISGFCSFSLVSSVSSLRSSPSRLLGRRWKLRRRSAKLGTESCSSPMTLVMFLNRKKNNDALYDSECVRGLWFGGVHIVIVHKELVMKSQGIQLAL